MKYKRRTARRITSIHDNWSNRLDEREQRLVEELLELPPTHMWAVYLEVMDRMPNEYKKRFKELMDEFVSGLPDYEKKLNEVEKIVGDTLKQMGQNVIDAAFGDDD